MSRKTPPCPLHTGAAVAAVLAGSWRVHAEPLDAAQNCGNAVIGRLLATGTGGLAWRCLRHSAVASPPAVESLHDAYRLHTLQAAIREHQLQLALTRFHRAGIEPLLSKGWAVARLYPEPGLRPFGDLDFFIHPKQFEAAQQVVKDLAGRAGAIDLHPGCRDLPNRPFEQLLARSRRVPLGTTAVRVPADEDLLRHLCLHLLRHGAWRPLWLCDIAVLMESAGPTFDWDLCLHGSRRDADAVRCALGLARQLLGARGPESQRSLPRWMAPAVLRQWGTDASHYRYVCEPMGNYLSRPLFDLLRALFYRWPNPITATARIGVAFNNSPRLPVQLADCLLRCGQWFTRWARTA